MKPTDIALDIAAFMFTLIFAIAGQWEAKDIIWGLWASSLCVGYAFIVTSIAAGVLHEKGPSRLGAAFGGLFLVAFFTFHFGMFHFVHGVFLNGFFPLVKEKRGFPSIFVLSSAAVKSYWPLVAASLMSRLRDFDIRKMGSKGGIPPFIKPYVNVVRMHLLIFVFAGLHMARLSQYAVYPVLVFYFFPWGAVIRWRKEARQSAARGQGGTP